MHSVYLEEMNKDLESAIQAFTASASDADIESASNSKLKIIMDNVNTNLDSQSDALFSPVFDWSLDTEIMMENNRLASIIVDTNVISESESLFSIDENESETISLNSNLVYPEQEVEKNSKNVVTQESHIQSTVIENSIFSILRSTQKSSIMQSLRSVVLNDRVKPKIPPTSEVFPGANNGTVLKNLDGRISDSVSSTSSESQFDMGIRESVIYSCYMWKKNRKGIFEKRLFRFDGTLLVCFSAQTGKTTNGLAISDFDLLDSQYQAIKVDMQNTIRMNYPPGPSASLAKVLLSKGSGYLPDPQSKYYYVPKWIVPVNQVKEMKISDGNDDPDSPESRTFTISSGSHIHELRAERLSDLNIFKFLLDTINSEADKLRPDFISSAQDLIKPDSSQVQQLQQNVKRRFEFLQNVWKTNFHNVVNRVKSQKKYACTIKLDSMDGLLCIKETVVLPAEPLKYLASQNSLKRNNGSIKLLIPSRSTSVGFFSPVTANVNTFAEKGQTMTTLLENTPVSPTLHQN